MAKTNRTTALLKLVESMMREERWHDAIHLLKENPVLIEKHWKLLWNLGWCYFKLEQMNKARKYLTRALQLAPKSHACKFALGSVYLEQNQYKKAELFLSQALQMKEFYATRIGLALAYLAQGKLEEAENTHLAGIRLKPNASERYESYAAFLFDVGRDDEAEKMNRKAEGLRRVN